MRLLVTGAWREATEHTPALERMGHEVAFLQQESDLLPCDPAWVEGAVCNGLFLYHDIAAFANLRYVQLTSVGYDRVDMHYCRDHGIEVRNARGVYSVPMAEFAVAGVLAAYKRLSRLRDQQRRHEWAKLRDLRELAGKRVLIAGCGSVGQTCAKRFTAFDCEVVGVDLEPRELPHFERVYDLEALDDQLALADIVIVCVPLTPQTEGLVRASRTKPDAIIVNISRGATVTLDVEREAVLDVFEKEPLPEDSPLWDCDDVLVTPHNSFVGEGNPARLARVILENLENCRYMS